MNQSKTLNCMFFALALQKSKKKTLKRRCEPVFLVYPLKKKCNFVFSCFLVKSFDMMSKSSFVTKINFQNFFSGGLAFLLVVAFFCQNKTKITKTTTSCDIRTTFLFLFLLVLQCKNFYLFFLTSVYREFWLPL